MGRPSHEMLCCSITRVQIETTQLFCKRCIGSQWWWSDAKDRNSFCCIIDRWLSTNYEHHYVDARLNRCTRRRSQLLLWFLAVLSPLSCLLPHPKLTTSLHRLNNSFSTVRLGPWSTYSNNSPFNDVHSHQTFPSYFPLKTDFTYRNSQFFHIQIKDMQIRNIKELNKITKKTAVRWA